MWRRPPLQPLFVGRLVHAAIERWLELDTRLEGASASLPGCWMARSGAGAAELYYYILPL